MLRCRESFELQRDHATKNRLTTIIWTVNPSKEEDRAYVNYLINRTHWNACTRGWFDGFFYARKWNMNIDIYFTPSRYSPERAFQSREEAHAHMYPESIED